MVTFLYIMTNRLHLMIIELRKKEMLFFSLLFPLWNVLFSFGTASDDLKTKQIALSQI